MAVEDWQKGLGVGKKLKRHSKTGSVRRLFCANTTGFVLYDFYLYSWLWVPKVSKLTNE
jgi:hypothetical protein